MCVVVEFLAFYVLLHTKSKKKVLGNLFCAPIIFKTSLKYTFTICVSDVFIVIGYFLLEKQTFDKLLKVIGVQNIFFIYINMSIVKTLIL